MLDLTDHWSTTPWDALDYSSCGTFLEALRGAGPVICIRRVAPSFDILSGSANASGE
jgi:hypothetical protein